MRASTPALGLRSYSLVTGGYWAFTVTDGAMRMLVLLHFHDLGYSPVAIAFLFLLYELMGIVTNLVGGWIGSQHGLQRTLVGGLALQVIALLALSIASADWGEWVSGGYVMGVQALSGVAKDLTKMSSKSAVKFVAGEGSLFRWVAALTGSKNALKGVGFFVGAALLGSVGYQTALVLLAGLVGVALAAVLALLRDDIGRSAARSFRSTLAKSAPINRLSAARFFLFGSRDIWFVVALPVFLDEVLGWSYQGIGAFLAAWVIGYGLIQSIAPRLIRITGDEDRGARIWIVLLALVSAAIAVGIGQDVSLEALVVVGLIAFGVVFAVNSSLHSYLILAYSSGDDVATDVGFYYSANAAGRLVGTLLSGVLYLAGGFDAALWGSAAFVAVAAAITFTLPRPEVSSAARKADYLKKQTSPGPQTRSPQNSVSSAARKADY
jgi:predicted MFS family arabinose efflux permease